MGLGAVLTCAQRELLEGEQVVAWVNATGLGARALVPDQDMEPVRGQTVLIEGEAEKIVTVVGEGVINYCIPRKGGQSTILGGTRDVGRW